MAGLAGLIGGSILTAYSGLCFYVAEKRPKRLFDITRFKLSWLTKNDDNTAKLVKAWAALALAAGAVVFVLGCLKAVRGRHAR